MPGDDEIVAAAVDGIRALNAAYGEHRHGASHDAPFYLLHRPRRWNAADAVWMGWERKRGKLVDFNAFISGADDDAFAVTEGDVAWLLAVRYVITLDADTVLPRGAAAALIGTIAHPLNRAEFDAERGRVVRGYGILQPRVSVSLASASESRFAAVYSGHPGRRSVHDRRVGRLPGSVRRRDVHGKGHLRRRCLSTRDRRPLSRQHAAQSRSHRGNVRARRTRHGRRSIRRLPDALSDVDAADAPMDSRRLAAAAVG